MRMTRVTKAVAVAAVAMLGIAACGSSKSGGSGSSGGGGGASAPASGGSSGGGSGGGETVKIGVLTDVTGPGASGNLTTIDGVKAGVVYAKRQGINIQYVVGDSATNPATILTAAQKLVTRDHVSAIIAVGAVTFGATNYLAAQRIPVIGAAQDGPEWLTLKNMFAVGGALDSHVVTSTTGEFFKQIGVTTVGTLGYGISPSSSLSAKASAESAKAAGLKVGYVNSNFPFGGTDVQPVALAMKGGGVDGFTASTDPNTAFALITALRQAGVDLKAALLPTGYGSDTTQAGPGALKAAQNVYFGLQYEPIEMQTAATKQFAADAVTAGVKGQAAYAEYNSYASVGLLVQALKAANGKTDKAAILTALQGIHKWDALGLFGGRTLDPNDRKSNNGGGVDNCSWITKLEGDKFTLVKDADPICGKVIDGVTVK